MDPTTCASRALECLQIREVLRPSGRALVRAQVIEGDDRDLDAVEFDDLTSSVGVVEPDAVDRRHQVDPKRGVPELDDTIRREEVIDGQPGIGEPEVGQRIHDRLCVLLVDEDPDVEVSREPGMTVEGDA